MTRDQQIGLALGILLVGAVSAFFFRHEEPAPRRLPALRTAAELDRQIAERPHAPYLTEPNDHDPATDLKEGHNRFATEQAGDPGLVPDPIALDGDLSSTVFASQSQPAVPTREQYHIVRGGDTLSSIALQYLGSTTRFQEVFEANRDRLRTPNDLRIGQEIRIPLPSRTTTPATMPRAATNQQPAPTSATDTPAVAPTEGERRFVPYRGSPLTPAATPPDAPPIAAPTSGRRLSQLPPKDGAVVR
jgi:LysM repeat protein